MTYPVVYPNVSRTLYPHAWAIGGVYVGIYSQLHRLGAPYFCTIYNGVEGFVGFHKSQFDQLSRYSHSEVNISYDQRAEWAVLSPNQKDGFPHNIENFFI